MSTGPGFIYRITDGDTGELLYLGYTANLDQRLGRHRRRPWWPANPEITSETFPSKIAAYATEQHLIRTGQGGTHNVTQAETARRALRTRARNPHRTAVRANYGATKAIEAKLGGPGEVEAFIRTRRATKRSWRFIARDLEEATGIEVTEQTVRLWFPDPVAVAS